jgi:hypothetical protein
MGEYEWVNYKPLLPKRQELALLFGCWYFWAGSTKYPSPWAFM